jgi:hypothetical protein
MLTLTVLWILFLLVTIYDNQTELFCYKQSCNYNFFLKKKGYLGKAQRKAISLKLTLGFGQEKWDRERGRKGDYAS